MTAAVVTAGPASVAAIVVVGTAVGVETGKQQGDVAVAAVA